MKLFVKIEKSILTIVNRHAINQAIKNAQLRNDKLLKKLTNSNINYRVQVMKRRQTSLSNVEKIDKFKHKLSNTNHDDDKHHYQMSNKLVNSQFICVFHSRVDMFHVYFRQFFQLKLFLFNFLTFDSFDIELCV